MTGDERRRLARGFRDVIAQIDGAAEGLSPAMAKRLLADLEDVASEFRAKLDALDPVRMPSSFFDPADPRLFGTFAAVALIGQDRSAMSAVAESKFYGAGVYAIYYNGSLPLYEPIAGSETPIYVGKADPSARDARDPKQQGLTLSNRLDEHRKNIERAENLPIEDFECRHLVVASGWQVAAESALIALFRPLWNKETNILRGFGKHGDDGDTRRNRRSPWDVMHPGRSWAQSGSLVDSKSPAQIEDEVRGHFDTHPPIREVEQVLHSLLARIRVA